MIFYIKPVGEIYSVTPKHFLRTGCRCTICRQTSRGETNIKFYLDEKSYIFEREYKFNDLWNINHTAILEFDFAIFDKESQKLKCIIEFDGIGHEQPIFPVNGTLEEKMAQLKRTQNNDMLKNEFCKKHNIPLLRIHYSNRDKKKMYPILDNFLQKFNDYPILEYAKNNSGSANLLNENDDIV